MIALAERSARGEATTARAVRLMIDLSEGRCRNEIVAPASGIIKKLNVKPGQNVEGKDVMIEIE